MEKKKSFIVYLDWQEPLSYLDNTEFGELFRALFSYVESGVLPKFSNNTLKAAFYFMKNALDRDDEKYENICKRNAENGKKGGRPKKQTVLKETQKSERFLKKPKKADNDNDNDSDNDNDNVNVNVNDNDSDTDNVNGSNISFSAKTARVYSEDFLLFWKEYPKKVGKGEAYKQWKKAKLNCDEKTDIINALKWQKKSYNWCNSNGRFIPNPSTYISQRRWEDEPDLNSDNDITDPNRYTDGDILPDYIMRGDY